MTKMKYLVTTEMMGIPPHLPQETVIKHLEDEVIPFLKAYVELENQGKILASGVLPGARAGVFIIEAESTDELDEILTNIPAWELFKTDVKPLFNSSSRLERATKVLEALKEKK